jgi:hypothetical protein
MVAENIDISTLTVEPRWNAGASYKATASYTLASAVETGDSFTFKNILPSPADSVQIVSGKLFGQEFDTNASPTATVIVGDGTDTDGYLSSKVSAADANGQFLAEFDGAFLGGTSQASRDLVVTLGGVVATAASSGTIFIEIEYYCAGSA